MSELARITAHYLAVIMQRSNMSASIPDMHAELAAAAEADAARLEEHERRLDKHEKQIRDAGGRS